MKIFLLNLILSVSANTEAVNTDDYKWVLEALQEESASMSAVATEGKVKIVDTFGNVVKEILKADYNENNVDANTIMTLSQSSFMFESLGNAYYLLED